MNTISGKVFAKILVNTLCLEDAILVHRMAFDLYLSGNDYEHKHVPMSFLVYVEEHYWTYTEIRTVLKIWYKQSFCSWLAAKTYHNMLKNVRREIK